LPGVRKKSLPIAGLLTTFLLGFVLAAVVPGNIAAGTVARSNCNQLVSPDCSLI